MHFLRYLASAAALLASTLAHAQHYTVGEIHIFDAYARPTVSHQPTGGAYLGMGNTGATPDRLVSVSSPAAKRVEIHTMSMNNDVMKMKEVGEIQLAPDSEIIMKPGDGYHLMLIGLNQRLKAGDKFPMTLVFEKAGKVEISVMVGSKAAKNGDAHHGHQQHGH